MKRGWMAALCLALFTLSFGIAAQAQSPSLLVIAKEANGVITRTSLGLTLNAAADGDQTQNFIPDGSKLASENLQMTVDSNGVGIFQGSALIVSPDGRVVVQGILRGTVGINPKCGQGTGCRVPGQLEGLLEAAPSMASRSVFRANSYTPVLMVNFSAVLNNLAAGPLPVYNGRLDGVISLPPTLVEKVKIAPDKAAYNGSDLITAIISNGSDKVIQGLDQQSYCTFVQLQIQENGRWTDVSVCPLNRAPLPTNIFPGQTLEVQLRPNPQTPGPNPPGVYRLALNFKVVENNSVVSDQLFVASEPFRVLAPPALDRVTVATDRGSYDQRERMLIRINNDNDQTIATTDHKSYCSVVVLQKQEGNNWVEIAPCQLLTPTRLIRIGSRSELLIKLPPENLVQQQQPGTYRLEFGYSFVDANGQPIGQPATSYSAPFTITSKQ